MENAVVKHEASSMVPVSGATTQDLVIPRLMLMQNTSELVGDGRAKLGDIVNSQTEEVIGGVGNPVEMIPLSMFKTWRVFDMSSGTPKFLRQEEFTVENANHDKEGKEGSVPVRWNLCYNFFMLLRKEVASGEAFPVLVTFTRTSAYAGRQLLTHFFKLGLMNKPHWFRSVLLESTKEKHETNTYSVFKVGFGTPVDQNESEVAKRFIEVLGGTVRVAPDVEEAAPQKPTGTREVEF